MFGERAALWLQIRQFHSLRDITCRNAADYREWRIGRKRKSSRTRGATPRSLNERAARANWERDPSRLATVGNTVGGKPA